AVQDMVEFHQNNGGISRFKKIEYLLQKYSQDPDYESSVQYNLAQFAATVHKRLIECPLNQGTLEFLRQLQTQNKFVVSGGLQEELIEVFQARELTQYFRGIYGSPENKREILNRIDSQGNLARPAAFIGDSRLDYEVAAEYGLDFIFMSRLSEFRDWK